VGNLIADIFVTIKPTMDRIPLSVRSLDSLFTNTDRSQFRLTLCFDGHTEGVSWHDQEFGSTYKLATDANRLRGLQTRADYILRSVENVGLGPTINQAIAHIKSVNDWYSHPTHGDQSKVAPYVVMCQDDLIYSPNWLAILASKFRAYGLQYKLGFASGVECIEHQMKKDLGNGIILKDWIRAAQMMGAREYWESLMPIPPFDPETGKHRAKPNDGMGSGVDWWLIRNHENSVCKTGRTCLVMPGLVQHAGFAQSTWLKDGREMPESDSDKEKVKNG
jgi:hypothetical protein